MATVGGVLRESWNPIGFADLPEDEYESYVGGVYRLLVSGATERQVAEHLRRLEVESMGMDNASADDLLSVARQLLVLDVRLK